MAIKHISITIRGKVQGVFFRASAKDKADTLGVRGFVCNQRNGDVYIEAEAGEVVLQLFIDWCHQGPPRASVEKVEMADGPNCDFEGFEIRR
jgi:acylphosphatase